MSRINLIHIVSYVQIVNFNRVYTKSFQNEIVELFHRCVTILVGLFNEF